MPVSFLGHTPNFNIWVFNIDGKRFVARNLSTPEPLNIKFAGVFDDSPLAAELVKTSGFDITESGPRIVVWTWAGRLYTSTWDINDEDIEDVVLYFSPPIPYSGPPVSPVGTGVTNTQSPPPPPVPTPVPSLPIDTTLISELKESIDNANKALAVSEAQRKVDIQALNTARIEIENSKQSLAQALSKASADQQVLLAQMQERIDAMQERADIQINIYKQMLAQQQVQTPPVTTPVVKPPITSPVVTTPTPTPTTAPSGTDWVKLGLQLGAAYLILS